MQLHPLWQPRKARVTWCGGYGLTNRKPALIGRRKNPLLESRNLQLHPLWHQERPECLGVEERTNCNRGLTSIGRRRRRQQKNRPFECSSCSCIIYGTKKGQSDLVWWIWLFIFVKYFLLLSSLRVIWVEDNGLQHNLQVMFPFGFC